MIRKNAELIISLTPVICMMAGWIVAFDIYMFTAMTPLARLIASAIGACVATGLNEYSKWYLRKRKEGK